jgi:hypothetical protein
MDFETIMNHALWSLTLNKYKDFILYCAHDHTYKWYPSKYLFPIYINNNPNLITEEEIKLDFLGVIQTLTGLQKSQITVAIYRNHEIIKLK